MKTAEQLRKAVDNYMEHHGMEKKKSSFDPFAKTYKVTSMDYTELDAKIVDCKNGNTKLVFKVNGKISSIKK